MTAVFADLLARIRAALTGVLTDPQTLAQLLASLVVLVAASVVVSVVARVISGVFERNDAVSAHQREVGFRLIQVAIYAVAGLTVLSIWKIDLANLLLGAGVLGVVIGLAARQTLASTLAGFVVLFARPFDIGDWVRIDEREGVVTEVSIFNTEVRTYAGEHVLIPNDRVTGSSIVNRSRHGRLRIDLEVGVDYDTDPDRAASVAREAMAGVDDVLSQPEPWVVHKRFDDSAVVLECRFWIDNPSAPKKWRTRTAVVESVKAAFEREGITIPFPQRTLSDRGDGGTRTVAGEVGEGVHPSADGGDRE